MTRPAATLASLVLLAGVWATCTAGCEPNVRDRQFLCEPLDPEGCPPGFACLRLGARFRCFLDTQHVCNNGFLEPNEACDGTSFGGYDCDDHGLQGSDMSCNEGCEVVCTDCGDGMHEAPEQCDLGEHNSDEPVYAPATPENPTSACRTDCTLPRCGDGIRDPGQGEDCDGDSLGLGVGCEELGFYGGALGCDTLCNYDVSGCEGYCGDGAVNADEEECDALDHRGLGCADFGFYGGALVCSSICRHSTERCFRTGVLPVAVAVPESIALRSVWAGDKHAYTVGEGHVLNYDGVSWQSVAGFTNADHRALWGLSEQHLVAVGAPGQASYRTTGWSNSMEATITETLFGVHGRPGGYYVAVGAGGVIYARENSEWSSLASPVTSDLNGVWLDPTSGGFAVGVGGTLLEVQTLGGWVERPSPTTEDLFDIWGYDTSRVFAVGTNGTILRYDGVSWQAMDSRTTQDLHAVWGRTQDEVYVVGASGTMLAFDGAAWQPVSTYLSADLYDVHSTSDGGALAVGAASSAVRHHGDGWLEVASATGLADVWAGAWDDVYVVGAAGSVLHYDGWQWASMDPLPPTTESLHAVWGTANGERYVVGAAGAAFVYDGAQWTPLGSGASGDCLDVWADDDGTVYLACDSGLHHRDAGQWSVAVPDATGFQAVWGISAETVFAAASTWIYRRDSGGWHGDDVELVVTAFWGTTPANVFANAAKSLLVFDGQSWSTAYLHEDGLGAGLHGQRSDHLFTAAGHFDGSVWSAIGSDNINLTRSVWVTESDAVYAVRRDSVHRFTRTLPTARGGACANPVNVYCGTTVYGSTFAQEGRVDFYQGCSGALAEGSEVIYKLDNPVVGKLVVTLEPHDANLDLYLLGTDVAGGCDPADECRAASKQDATAIESISLQGFTGDVYYLAVETVGEPSGYALTVSCEKQ